MSPLSEFHLQYRQEVQQYLLELCDDYHRGYRNSTLGFFLILHSENNNIFPCDVHNVLLINQTDWIQIPGILLKACLRCSVSTLAIRLPVLCPLLTHIFIYSLIVQHLRCYSALMMKLQMSGLKMLLAICDWGECEWTRFFFQMPWLLHPFWGHRKGAGAEPLDESSEDCRERLGAQ